MPKYRVKGVKKPFPPTLPDLPEPLPLEYYTTIEKGWRKKPTKSLEDYLKELRDAF